MPGHLKRHLTYANVTATLALVVALGGTSYAALRIGSRQIVNNSVRSVDVRDNTLQGKDARNRSLTGRDIEKDSLGGLEIAEGELGTVREAWLIQGRSLSELIVGCTEPARATGTVCMETSPRPPAGFLAANNQCSQVGGRLPLYTELVSSGGAIPVPEWTSDLLDAGGGAITTLVIGDTAFGAAPTSPGARPYRCARPLSNLR